MPNTSIGPWKLVAGTLAHTTSATAAVAHGLPRAPTFVLAQSDTGVAVTVSATATTLSLAVNTGTDGTISYLLGS